MHQTESASALIAPLLLGDERLLWSGRPRQGIFLRASDAYLIPFSLIWGGFAFFWESTVVRSHAPVFFLLWGIPFVLLGIYLIAGRFFFDATLRSRTYYGLTTERIVITSGIFSRTIKSLQLRTLSDVSLAESADGSGTITFGPVASSWHGAAGWPGTRQRSPMFDSIPSAREVYEKIRRAQKES